ncbi:hypothetical protein SK128_004571 [Halocaridina rubra]|uniref:N-acetyltransferase domain-containing protein n=1 Tax=Halocaridina rubra TaxID=373956 RepID=A0AAN8ZT95_HALRR
MHPYLANVVDSCLPGNISVGMREKATGRLVGVMLNVIITPETDDVIQLGDYPTEKCRLYREMMEQLCLGTNVLRDFGKKKQFEFFLLTTHPDYSGKGLGKELIRVSEGICKENGCDVASIQASNPITEIIVSKMGFKVIKSFDVTSFKSKEGKQILDGTNMNGTTHFTYLIKEY